MLARPHVRGRPLGEGITSPCFGQWGQPSGPPIPGSATAFGSLKGIVVFYICISIDLVMCLQAGR